MARLPRFAPQSSAAALALALMASAGPLGCASKSKRAGAGEGEAGARTNSEPDAQPSQGGDASKDPPGSPSASPPPVSGARIWVTGDTALLGIDLDGKVEHSIPVPDGVGPVRRRSTADFVGLALGDPGEVVVFGRGDPKRIPIPTVIPQEGCTPRLSQSENDYGAADDRLELQDRWDFSLGNKEQQVCILLLDRNINMASYGIEMRVDLGSGKTETLVYADESGECASDEPLSCEERDPLSAWIELEDKGPWADWKGASVDAEEKRGEWRFSYDARTGKVSDRKGDEDFMLCGAEKGRAISPESDCAGIENVSSSYRWLLVHGPIEEGDYIHRDLFILDRQSGELLTVESDTEKEKRRLEVIEPAQAFGGQVEAFDAVGESDIAALPADRFWLDGLLVVPERRVAISVHGTRVLTAGE